MLGVVCEPETILVAESVTGKEAEHSAAARVRQTPHSVGEFSGVQEVLCTVGRTRLE